MRLIRMLEIKDGAYRKYGLFFCQFCGKEVERLKSNGLRANSCGCRRWEVDPDRQRDHHRKKLEAEHKKAKILAGRALAAAKDRARDRSDKELELMSEISRLVGC